MSVADPFVHHIDPIIGTLFGVHFWWYGLSYTLGFLNAHLLVMRRRNQLGLSVRGVYNLSILLAVGVLLGGRFVEVAFYEWPFYRDHVWLIPAYWLGGMATHGLLFGGLVGLIAFSSLQGKRFLTVTDALAIPAAAIMGIGRLGNFIDGQIVGSVTTVWWAVKFPDAEGFRHPVVLYDGLKNLLVIPILWFAASRTPPTGVLTGIFLFLYAFLRIFVDLFREYPTSLLGLATGQVLNVVMSLLGLILIAAPYWRRHARAEGSRSSANAAGATPTSLGVAWRRAVFAALLGFSLILPSDWTQDVPARYGKRHEGLTNSAMYPKIDSSPPHSPVEVPAPETSSPVTPPPIR
jgi:phosphatidylglycerol:prolipoprotein diacylglycerol transferase